MEGWCCERGLVGGAGVERPGRRWIWGEDDFYCFSSIWEFWPFCFSSVGNGMWGFVRF